MDTANKCLEKLKLPPMEISQGSDWNAVQARMEHACSAIEKVSARDNEMSGMAGKMKKAFRGLCKNAGTGKMFTSMIPDDMGGSILSGGLNVIFTTLEQTSVHREAVYKALERLPRILNDHVQYLELANEDAEVHRRTAKLYTEVLLTLDHILRWYMTHAFVAGAKRLLNPSALSTNLNDRLAEVNLAAKDLKARGVHVIRRQTQEKLSEISTVQEWTSYENVKVRRRLDEIDLNIKRIADRSDLYEGIETAVYDSLQSLLQGVVKNLTIKNTEARDSISTTPSITCENVLEELETEIDVSRVHALQGSPRLREWLTVDEGSLLLVNGGATDPLDLSTSFANARMIHALMEQSLERREGLEIIPLVYLCSQHRNYYRDVDASPTSLAMSLLLQLIDHFPGFKGADLQECLDETDGEDVISICSSLGRLVRRLPSSAVVYLILDGLSFFGTPVARMKELRRVIHHLVSLHREGSRATLKFMFSSSTRSRHFGDLFEEDEILNVPASPVPMGGPEA
ncbi:hypothetical protein BKA67DRAFT_213127 [Truncatella angustata]|uniref:Uncharacterized protein n=1 Tax=Truncatella angustata TaxID=152316 RepID=A0A9P8UUF2_9PEZI|nr:uncharacterized protein BKA67DRAFT_213127 [Truncatella angustata]KAH6658381.1 hypothetical protein BKA67DRAFT_213127 [Truncatella angustata]